jgi:hypothetical protein
MSPRSSAARADDRRSRKEIAADVSGHAAICVDALKLGRRTEIEGLISELIRLAIAEYRKRFPRHPVFLIGPTRFVSEWVTRRGRHAIELECLFCRAKLHELGPPRAGRAFSVWPKLWRVRVEDVGDRHGEECAVRMLAGLMKPVPMVFERRESRSKPQRATGSSRSIRTTPRSRAATTRTRSTRTKR